MVNEVGSSTGTRNNWARLYSCKIEKDFGKLLNIYLG